MTPRKELFIKIKEQLMQIQELQLVDFYRGQFEDGAKNYPDIWTGALIRVNDIRYETMVEHKQEGLCTVDVFLYCKDGWMDQHNTTADPDHGLNEIDLLDKIIDQIQFLKGDNFKPLQQSNEDYETTTYENIMEYRMTFDACIYKRTRYNYTFQRLGSGGATGETGGTGGTGKETGGTGEIGLGAIQT